MRRAMTLVVILLMLLAFAGETLARGGGRRSSGRARTPHIHLYAPHAVGGESDPAMALIWVMFILIVFIAILVQSYRESNPGGTIWRPRYQSHAAPSCSTAQTSTPTWGARPHSYSSSSKPPGPSYSSRLCRFGRDALGKLLSFRWVFSLPDWCQPIVFALVLTFPTVLLIVRWQAGATFPGDVSLCLGFIVAGAATGGFGYDGLQGRSRRKAAEEAESRSEARRRFRSVLVETLQRRPATGFCFVDLIAEHGLSREDADRAADGVYRWFARRVVADGVISRAERMRLDCLASDLEIDAERRGSIDHEAKAEIYKRAMDEALADGIVTDEESRQLESLRLSLGMGEYEGFIAEYE